MGSSSSKEMFCLSLCLITLFSFASCSSTITATRSVAEESEVKRVPPADARGFSKIVNRQFVQGRE